MNVRTVGIGSGGRLAMQGVLLAGMLCGSQTALGEAPRLTVDNAAKLIGKTATLELVVVSVKFAERRKTHFLSSTGNFRSSSNLAVAIRQDDFENFRRAKIDDLAAQYQDRRIRATGLVARDEGQFLLAVTSPDQIEVLGPAGEPQGVKRESKLDIVDERGQSTTLEVPLADDLPRETLRIEHEGVEQSYSGVPLAAVLKRAGVTTGAESRGRSLARYVVVSADDDYVAVFSIAEIDPFLSDQKVLLAESLDGRAIAPLDGPLLLVAGGDKRQRRWLRQVSRIAVRSALEKTKPDGK